MNSDGSVEVREEFSEEFTESIGSRFVDKIAVEYAYQDINKLPEMRFMLP